MISTLFQPPVNSTLLTLITPSAVQPPFYHTTRPSILSFISDKHLSLALPVLVYWGLSLLFHLVEVLKIPYFEARKVHDSPEVLSRNRATISQVVKAVVWQHVLQTILGYLWLEDDEILLRKQLERDDLGGMASLTPMVAKGVMLVVGPRTGQDVFKSHGEAIVRWMYWWGMPSAKLFLAFFVMDTWQYFIHRLFHTSRFLYRHIHSVHHRLYVPYAFGALYNHPLEGILFDSLGAAVAEHLAGLSIRQACLFFALSTMKTVDDHCGYRLWWDPCQMFFANNVDYHDIHHQAYGIKSNFSQPFFTNWDKLLGTIMTREQADIKTRRATKVD